MTTDATLTGVGGGGSRPDGATAALEVSGAAKSFGATRALDGVNLRVEPGSVTALLGANGSGKSTLIRALAGYHSLDEGTITVHGTPLGHSGHAEGGQGADLRFVHQDLALIPTLSVADNLAMGRGFARDRLGSINWRREAERVRLQLASVGLDIDPMTEIKDLGPVDRTLVAIARALDGIDVNRNVLVLDEPTARLPREEAARLIERLVELKQGGLPILYITHRLEELDGFADWATILRDGREVYNGPYADLSPDRLRALIAGLDLSGRAAAAAATSTPVGSAVALKVRGLSSARLRNLNFEVHEGELLAVTGLVGSGRSELGRVVYGLQPFDAGEIHIGGESVGAPLSSARTALDVGYLPQERVASLMAGLRVQDNVTIASFKGLTRWTGVIERRLREVTQQMIEALQIKPPDPDALVDTMSGGNAQKVAVARWLRIPLRLLVLDEPTQSIDVGAKADLMEAIRERAAATGMGVLWLESDIEEVVKYADRVLVMADGRIVAEFTQRPFSVAEIVAQSYGGEQKEEETR